MKESQPILFNLKAVCRATGLAADRLRAWERRYGAIVPLRSPSNGRRVYSQAQVARLKLLATLVNRGHAIHRLASLEDEILRQMVDKLQVGSAAHGEPVVLDVEHFLGSIHRFDVDQARRLLVRLRYQSSPRDFIFHWVPRIMEAVDQSMQQGLLGVSHEHAASELVRFHLRGILEELEPLSHGGAGRTTMIFSTPEGHRHDFGLLMAAIIARSEGLPIRFMGSDLPAHSLVEAAIGIQAGAVVLGVSDLPKSEEAVSLRSYLTALDDGLPKRISFWLGGPGVRGVRREFGREVFFFDNLADFEAKIKAGVADERP